VNEAVLLSLQALVTVSELQNDSLPCYLTIAVVSLCVVPAFDKFAESLRLQVCFLIRCSPILPASSTSGLPRV